MHQLMEWDRRLFGLINREWTNSFFDWLFPIARNQSTWYPLYGILLIVSIYLLRKRAIWWALFYILTVAVSDQTGMLFKNFFERLRPCRQSVMPFRLLVEYCPSSFSFISNHASNHFAMASFIFFSLTGMATIYRSLFFLWAILVCYAQVYVGVHYPADVFAGAIVGFLLGWLFSKAYFFTLARIYRK